jgi:endonuclease YncB( thermonuclease family)
VSLKCASQAITLLILFPLVASAGEFKVTRVYGGDTLKAQAQGLEIRIRLVGIDAPETSKKKGEPGQPFSQKAKKHLASLVLNRKVKIKEYGRDRYGRILGVVFLDAQNLNLEMVRAGLAEVYRGKHAPGFDPDPYMGC